MKSFNSFEEIARAWNLPDKWLLQCERYFAHTNPDKNPEPFIDHVSLVNEYALRLVKAHDLNAVVDRLVEDLLQQTNYSDEAGKYIKSLFLSTILYHDYGKINPNFQVEKMGNSFFFSPDKSIKIGSQHSRLSAYLYLNFHIDAIKNDERFTEDERLFLWTFSFLFANAIFLHHSGSFYHEVKLDDTLMPSLQRFLKIMESDTAGEEYIHRHKEVFRYFSEELKPLKAYFSVFALLKLNFSLLTAADYLATNEYMNDLPVTDFGLMDNRFKKDFSANFYSLKDYNRHLAERSEYYSKLPFKDLQERSSDNLNLLRQKLTTQVLESIRHNAEAHLFYLEAPTGAGKTNLSLALANELLEANPELNKIFYVFPFTTLITQTFKGIKETVGLNNSQVIELHSKAGFHQKEAQDDGAYGDEKLNYIDNLFINYPVTLLTHIHFFDILKGNEKESNYILHRLSNSVVIIDELQSYNPRHWDKIIFYLSEYARLFNIRFVMMSATLPYIDELLEEGSPMKGKAVRLVKDRDNYFLNPNFGERVNFNFDLLQRLRRPSRNEEREMYLRDLKSFLFQKAEEYARYNDGKSRVIIEFIKKKSASAFYQLLKDSNDFSDYQLSLISGEILEPRRREIISEIKANKYQKILLITTQVVEAGVDIDMDIGFKDKSIPDSDEQLAGRVNRNASKSGCSVFLFDFDDKAAVYGKDERYKLKIDNATHRQILEQKNFRLLYDKVVERISERNNNPYLIENLKDYLCHFELFDFKKVSSSFKLIEENTLSVFVPFSIPAEHFHEDEKVLELFGIKVSDINEISGQQVWEKYESLLISSKSRIADFIQQGISLKQIAGLMSKFVFSFYIDPRKSLHALSAHGEKLYGYFYLRNWGSNEGIYSYKEGLNMSKVENDNFL